MSELLCELLGERLMDRDQAEVECSPLGTDGRLVALYFGCSWSASCKEFTAALADFYSRFKQGENGDKLEVVFISSEEEYKPWKEFVGQMPWLVLPFQDMERKIKLWSKYKVTNVPSLIFIEGSTGRTISRNGHLIIRDDPLGSEFPWGSKSFGEVMAGSLIKNNGQVVDSTALDGSYVGVYFSAHWCPPCRSLTRVLVETYRKIKEMGHKFEIVFVSADRSEDSFKQYFNEMPWLAVPYTDEARRSRLNWNYGIQGIPTLLILDQEGKIITRQGRPAVLNDIDCKEFPWHPKPVLELKESNALQLNERPSLVLFVDSEEEELEPAKQLIQPIAEKIFSEHKAKDEDPPLLFFVAGEDDMTESLRDFTNLPESAPLLTILDMSQRAKYVKDVEEITPAIVEEFVKAFLKEKLKPEPI
ncbi:nucleoredoxin isoform X1 [Chiloscyllium plagiosum]|uniref:nucleoredoxin isoform X1 n=1 Tax=Chiloscyllium plagiosum TaxID=36176 RepID=UPI001CB7E6F3|nr:nucleoredoxin isoform X1 [Chiloscyllium plagiosum]